jgi:hypothetical protein
MLNSEGTLQLVQVGSLHRSWTGMFRQFKGTIVHPKATIFALAGPIVIGTACIIEEGAIIVNKQVLLFREMYTDFSQI